MQRLAKVRQLLEVILTVNGLLKLLQAAVELPGQRPTGGIADHGDVHSNQIPLKGRLPAALNGFPQTLPGLLSEALHLHNVRLMLIQLVNVHRTVNPAPANQPLQRCLRQPFNVHCLLTDEMDELPQTAGFTGGIVAEQRLGIVVFMDTGRLAAARTLVRNGLLHTEAAPVQIFLHMGDNHVPFGHQHPVPRHQLQALNKGEVMQAGPGNGTAVNLHRIKDRYRGNLPRAAGCPFNLLEPGFKQVILKFERKAVLVMVAGASAGLGVGDVVIGHHDPINRNVIVLGELFQPLDTVINLFLLQRPVGDHELTEVKAQRRQIVQLVRFALLPWKALQHIERHKRDTARPTVSGIQQPDGASGQVAPIFVRLACAVQQGRFQRLKIAGADECLTRDH